MDDTPVPSSSRPLAPRRATTSPFPVLPLSSPPPSPVHPQVPLSHRTRNTSPYSRSYGPYRSRSSAASHLAAPPMARAHSSPTPTISRSPLGSYTHSPIRAVSPLRHSFPMLVEEEDEEGGGNSKEQEGEDGDVSELQVHTSAKPLNASLSLTQGSIQATPAEPAMDYIPEDAELDFSRRAGADVSAYRPSSFTSTPSISLHSSPSAPVLTLYNTTSYAHNNYGSNTFPRRHHFPRRPQSPLQAQPFSTLVTKSQPTSATSSPKLAPTRFVNEAYPALSLPRQSSYSNTSSSMPSTPTSARSRSPSISSLETIPDSPDAEEAALREQEEMRKRLDSVAESAEEWRNGEERDGGVANEQAGRKGSLDLPRGGRWDGGAVGRRDGAARKRWSVCGAERWGDERMETIWED